MKPPPTGYAGTIYRRFLKIRGTPREIGLGFALGIFIGFSPTMGIQIAVAVFLASVLKWSKIAAALGVQITNPLTAPFIYGFTYLIGARIIGLEKPLKPSSFTSIDALTEMVQQAPRIFAALTIGGILVGLPLAIACYLALFRGLERYQESIKTGIRNRTRKISQKIKRPGVRKKKRRK